MGGTNCVRQNLFMKRLTEVLSIGLLALISLFLAQIANLQSNSLKGKKKVDEGERGGDPLTYEENEGSRPEKKRTGPWIWIS